MGTSMKILRHRTLREGYISAGALTGEPQNLFVCIWPADPHIKERIRLSVRSLPQSPPELPAHERYALVVGASLPPHRYVLKFYKTAEAFDDELPQSGTRKFFWKGGKGSRFQVTTDEVTATGIIFRCTRRINNHIIFLNMLATIGEEGEEGLTEYLEKNFDVIGKRTYSFEVYLRVPFVRDEIRFGESAEEVYRFSRDLLPNREFPIASILYEYPHDTARKARRRFDDTTVVAWERSKEDLAIDVKEIMSECIRDFFGSDRFKDHRLIDDNASESLAIAIIERLKESLK